MQREIHLSPSSLSPVKQKQYCEEEEQQSMTLTCCGLEELFPPQWLASGSLVLQNFHELVFVDYFTS